VHQLVGTGWQSIRIVGASACVIFILHQKIQKMVKCTFWYWLTWVSAGQSPQSHKMVVVVVSKLAKQVKTTSLEATSVKKTYNAFSSSECRWL